MKGVASGRLVTGMKSVVEHPFGDRRAVLHWIGCVLVILEYSQVRYLQFPRFEFFIASLQELSMPVSSISGDIQKAYPTEVTVRKPVNREPVADKPTLFDVFCFQGLEGFVV